MASPDTPLQDQVRSYYGTVGRYIESELRARRDRGFWRRAVREARPSSVLELGCGTGRVTEVLASHAPMVVGIDLSPSMIRRARDRHPPSGRGPDVPAGRVHLILADMRSLRLNHRFDLVVAANDPFVHLLEDEDRDRALRTVRRHLATPEGRFILDGFWLASDRQRRASSSVGYRRERRVEFEGSEIRIRESWRCRPGTSRCGVRFEYFEGDRLVDRAAFRARLWNPDEIRPVFARAGLVVDRLRGGFDGRVFDARTSGHLIIEARGRDRWTGDGAAPFPAAEREGPGGGRA